MVAVASPLERDAIEPFVPHPLLRGPHRQTLAGRFLRREDAVRWRRETLDTPDGDRLDVDFLPAPELPDAAPTVLILHGLEGSAGSGYVGVLSEELAARRLRPVALNYRSCGGRVPLQPRSYHAGETGDPRLVLELLARRWPRSPLGAVGFSLGGNILLKLLGEGGAGLRAGVSVSAPHDLARSVARLQRGFSRVYERHLLGGLQGKLAARPELGELVDLEEGLRTGSLRSFDDRVTAPLHGFAGADDYYARCSSAAWVDRIAAPTLVLRALDDPFLDPDDVACLAGNPQIEARLSAHGGHVGFVAAGPRGGLRYWAEATAARWLDAQLR